MKVGDLVTSKTHGHAMTFCIIDFKTGENGECVAVLKALYNNTIIVDVPINQLENLLPTGKL